MKHGLLVAFSTAAAVVVALGAVSANAQVTSANGPYYATPSWDQQLPVSTRFIVLSNWKDTNFPAGGAAVLDRETGLVWERSPSTSSFPWEFQFFQKIADDHCNDLSVGNRKGWRVPSAQELASLIDPTRSDPALPAGHPFLNVQSEAYWTATPYRFNNRAAWRVFLFDGRVSQGEISLEQHVWCVRGGQGTDVQ